MAVEALVLKAQIRNDSGSKNAAALRQQGMIPAVVYGHKEKPVSIAINEHDFLANLQHGSRLFDIEIDSKKEKLLIKDVQYDHLGKDILHADFMRVDLTEKVKVAVPIEIKGTAKGAAEGGVVDQHLAQLEVECVVTNIPASITVSIKELGVGDSIKAGDITAACRCQAGYRSGGHRAGMPCGGGSHDGGRSRSLKPRPVLKLSAREKKEEGEEGEEEKA